MKPSAIFHSSTIYYLQFFLLHNCYTVDGYSLTESFATGWSHPTDYKPTPPVHLLIFNRLTAPMRYLDSAFKGKGDFNRMEHRRIEASSWGEVLVTADPLYEDIYGFIRFIATDSGLEIPISLFFSIPSEHLKRLSWYGIEIYSVDPHALMCRAGNSTDVSQLNDGFRRFAYQNNDEMISQVNSQGLTLAARMYKHPMDRVIVKLRVWNSKMTAPMSSTEAVFTAGGTHTTNSPSSRSTTFSMPTTTQMPTTTETSIPVATSTTTKTSTATKTVATNKTTAVLTTKARTTTPAVTTTWNIPALTMSRATVTTTTQTTTKSTFPITPIPTALSSTTSTTATISATPTVASTTPKTTPTTLTSTTSTIHLTNSTTITTPTTANTTPIPIAASTTPTTTTTTVTTTTKITSTASSATTMLTATSVDDYEYYGETVPW